MLSVKFTSILLLLLTTLWTTYAYRIKGSIDENRPFIPFEKGFVQSLQDPKASITNRTITNQGRTLSLSTTAQRGIENDVNRLFICPNMVGPFYDENDGNDNTTSNGYYYCTSNLNGYCDRRSGICLCNEGYIGDGCESCDTLTHIDVGGMMCHPKRLCPNDCSNSNLCNYITGKCECSNHRTGDDCSQSKCSLYHHFCTHCNDEKCLQCEDGWNVVDPHDDDDDGDKSIASLPSTSTTSTSTCEPCWRYDPRCRECNSKTCTSCIDLLLLSIHRSGLRPQDPPLPIDERLRELSVTVPFGSLNDDAYYDAEHYFLVGGEDPTTSLAVPPLNASAVECHQGLNSDDTITCIPYNLTSHILCGNYGTINFVSPEYAIQENDKYIRLTLQRSGGGVGEVSVSYSIYPMTANMNDVTSTAYYTTDQTIAFRPGQIRASFLVTINDDRIMEANETFSVHLSKPTGGCQLGTQSRTIVTIIDDDVLRTCSNETYLEHNIQDLGSDVKAGTPLSLTVIAKKCNGDLQTVGMDVIRVEARTIRADNFAHELNALVIVGNCSDSNNGTYACDVAPTVSGNYHLDVYLLVVGGLKGYYYTDNYLSDERLSFTRTDAVVNFTWGEGSVTTFGRDFVSVRWEGYVIPSYSEMYTFWMDVDDHVRLWVDGILLIDSWTFPTSSPAMLLRADYDLTALVAYEVIMEYREITGNATARLLWSSPSTSITAIPSSSLFYKEPIQNKPFMFGVSPSDPSALRTQISREGVCEGIAGNIHAFTIVLRDSFGNLLEKEISDHSKFQGHAEFADDDKSLLGNSPIVPVIITYNDTTRNYDSTWIPIRSGMYRLNITYQSCHIFGSPFLIKTKPGAIIASESIAKGGSGNCLQNINSSCPGTSHGMAGQDSIFYIETYDLYRNRRNVGEDDWKVVLNSMGYSKYSIGRIHDFLNGTYRAAVTPMISGPNELHITLNGVHIKSSPFRMDVIHGLVKGSSSYVVDEDRFKTMTAMLENVFQLQATDEYGNSAIYCGVHPFEANVTVEGNDVDDQKTRVRYIRAGLYKVSIYMLRAGQRSIAIKMNGSEIKRSPFNVTVLSGPFAASFTSASGVGLSRATAGEEAEFVIQEKDLGGNNKVKDDAQLNVFLQLTSSVNTSVELGSISYVGNGQHLVQYTCLVSGEYVLTVRDQFGSDIDNSPFHVTVAPSTMSAPHSLVTGQGLTGGVAGEVAELRVIGRDRYENRVNHAVEIVDMTLSLTSHHQSDWEDDPVDKHKIKQIAKQNGEGEFNLDFTPTISGSYDLELSTYSPGGLEGSYFSSQDLLPDFLVASQLDTTIEKYFKDDLILEMIGTQSHFGAQWKGKIIGQHSENYTYVVYCGDGGQSSIAIDGKHVSYQSCDPSLSTTIFMQAGVAVNFSLLYKSFESRSAAFVKLMWASPSLPLQIIPSHNLFHQARVGDASSRQIEIAPNQIQPAQSNVIGDLIKRSTAFSGIEHVIVVECRDDFGVGGIGNLMITGGAKVEVLMTNHHTGDNLYTTVHDNNNGTYTVSYTPVKAALYFLSATVDGVAIKGSPFLIDVMPGESDPSESTLLGVEDGFVGVTGSEVSLEFQAMDINLNKRHKGGDTIIAVMSLVVEESEETLLCISVYKTDGLYAISCPGATNSGSFLLDVKLMIDSTVVPIKSSPFIVTIYPGNASPETTHVISGGSAN